MTSLRRARREVYRVYGEDEFFDGPGLDRCFETPGSRTDGRLRRLAGAMLLLAAVGAVAGMVAITSMSSVRRNARRPGNDLLATAGLRGALRVARARVWRQPAAGAGSPRRGASSRRGTPARAPRHAGIPPRAAAFRGARSAAPHRGVAAEVASHVGSVAVAVASTRSSTPVAATKPNPGASSGAPYPQSEFGFERGGAR